MKFKFVLLLLCCALSTGVFAHGIGAVPVVKDARWTAVQIGVWPLLLFDDGAKVMGLNLDLILTCQRRAVWGLTLAPFNACEDDVGGLSLGLTSSVEGKHYGLCIALVSRVGADYGVQLGLANLIDSGIRNAEERCGGLQIGLFNDSDARGVQIGLLNHNPKAWLPWMPLVNCCFRKEGCREN